MKESTCMKKNATLYLPLFTVAILVFSLILIFKDFLIRKDINTDFVMGANFILFALSITGLFIQSRGAVAAQLSAFLRGIYSSLLLKMFLVAGGIIIYVTMLGGEINKGAIFISMALYFVYTAIEVTQIMKIVRRKTNG